MYNFGTGKSALQLSVNWFAVKAGFAYFPFIYGPPFIFGAAGIFTLLRSKESCKHWSYKYVFLAKV